MALRNISAWSIRNPVPALVLFAALTVTGLIAFLTMPVNQAPELTFPAVLVQISQPGAAPSEIETQITQKVEAAVRGVEGVDEVQSTVAEGSSTTFVQFTFATPVDRAVNEVRDRVSQIRAQLPEGVVEPAVSRVILDAAPVANWSVEGTDMTLEQLSWFVNTVVEKRLLAIPGMQAVQLAGGVDRAIRVTLDPARMQALGVTAAQVNQVLRGTNQNAAGGKADIGGAEQAVRVVGNARDAYSLGQTQIPLGGAATGAAARTVKLADVADVRDSSLEQLGLAKSGGKQVVGFSIMRARGASEVDLFDATVKELARIQAENPRYRFTQRFTQVSYIKRQYRSAVEAMVEGAVLAVLVVFLFLRDKRATVISALAIPLSAIPTFWVMQLLGLTLNSMTLLALSLVAGVLVDDAIVEIENIVRHMRMGKSAWQASIDAADEIGLAVVATTFSIVAVFLPVALMPGIAGQYFKNFGITVVVAVLMSLLVARLLTPMVAAYFLKAGGVAEHGEGPAMRRYLRLLAWTLANRWKTVAAGAAAFMVTVWLFMTLPFTFAPPVNADFSNINVAMPPGTTLEQTAAAVDAATRIVAAQPEVAQPPIETMRAGSGQINIMLRRDRVRTSSTFERETQRLLDRIPDARISFAGHGFGEAGRAVQIMLAGNDPDQLALAANTLAAQMRGLPMIRNPLVQGDTPRPEITVTPLPGVAADLGVTAQALGQTIRIATAGDINQNQAKFSLADRQIPIDVALDPYSRRDLSTIENLPVPTSRGGTVPLKVVARIGFGAGPAELKHFNQERRIVVDADIAPGAVSGEQRALAMKLPIMRHLPPGVHYAAQGAAKWQLEMVNNFVVAVIAGVLLVLAVLVLLYRRAMPPFVNLGSLLLAPLGGALALHLAGMPISLPVLIGLLMLLGIVAKNSILLIDFALEEMRLGVPAWDAIMEAGHKRAQPIVMTTVAMVAGMVPTALSIGGDGSFNQPMAVVVMGGLALSTVLTLLIVPASFSLAIDAEAWVGPRLGRRLLSYRPGDEAGGPVLEGGPRPPRIGRGPGALPAAE